MKQIRIQSDGTPNDTVITNADGTILQNVTDVVISINVKEIARVDLEIVLPKCDVHALPRDIEFTCQCCYEVLKHECKGLS